MEANWNQLIERYLENELSEEGKQAFEAELASNQELQAELDIHQTVRDGAVRSAQRVQLASIGASYHRSVRMKQAGVAAAIIIGAGLTTAVLLFNGKSGEKSTPTEQQEQPISDASRTAVAMPQTVSDSTVAMEEPLQTQIQRALIYPKVKKNVNTNSFLDLVKMENEGVSLQKDPVVSGKGPIIASNGAIIDSGEEAHSGEKLYDTILRQNYPAKGMALVMKDGSYGVANSEGLLVAVPKYDSIGKFDDLIPCLALVMDEKKFGFIDKTGKEVIPLTYDQIVETKKFRRRIQIAGLRGHKGEGLFRRKKPRTFYIFAGENTSYCDQ